MPIPTRAKPEPHAGPEAISKIPSARIHQRTNSTVVRQSAKAAPSTHQRASSLIPNQPKVGQTEPNSASLLRKPSVRTNATSNLRQTAHPALIVPKSTALVPTVPASASSNSDSGLRQPTLKPQFTAYRQHFTPKKPPRPASIASDTPGSTETAVTSHEGREVGRLRDELLQLRLMHSGSKETLRRFECDARMKLESKFEALMKQDESISKLERHGHRCTSHTALQAWLDQGDEVVDHKLLQLASCVRDLDSLTAKYGDFSSLMRQFQAWFEHMTLALDSRGSSSETASQDLLFVETIDPLWLQESEKMRWRLEKLRRMLHDLGASDAGGIKLVLKSYRGLADNLHNELVACLSIHAMALEQQDVWVESSLQRLFKRDIPVRHQAEAAYRRGIWVSQYTKST